MNQKKAKKLRKLAGGNEAIYSEMGSPRIFRDINGMPTLVAKGTSRRLSSACSRKLYKDLKAV